MLKRFDSQRLALTRTLVIKIVYKCDYIGVRGFFVVKVVESTEGMQGKVS